MKKTFLILFSTLILTGCPLNNLTAFGYSSNYTPPEGAGQDMYGFMYSDYKKDPAAEEERPVMPLPAFMKRKEADTARLEPHEIKTNVNKDRKNTPINYNQFPQNIDSAQQMMMMQNGMQNMFGQEF